jgi:uncharacterized membrane protein YdcZ (DUF606 family)
MVTRTAATAASSVPLAATGAKVLIKQRMKTALNKTSALTKPFIYSLILFAVGFILFFSIQAMADPMQSPANVETLDKNISLKRISFLVLIVCSLTATILSWSALRRKKSTVFYLVFIAELLFTIALIVFFLYSRTLFWM